MPTGGVSKTHADEPVEVDEWIVQDKIHHRVLADIVHDGHSLLWQTQQEARDADKGAQRAQSCTPRTLHPLVEAHVVFPMIIAIAHDEKQYQQQGHHDGEGMSPVPASEAEEKQAHRHIAQRQPQRIASLEKPVADEGQHRHQQAETLVPTQRVNSPDNDVSGEEREQEPHGWIPPEMAHGVNVVPMQPLRHWIQSGHTVNESEEHQRSNQSPHQIGHEQSLHPVLEVSLKIANHSFIKVARLEKEERHEEKRPCHQFAEPKFVPQSADADRMQQNHPQNTQSAQQVKGVVSFFHAAKVRLLCE